MGTKYDIRNQCLEFFLEAKKNHWISSVVGDLGDDLSQLVQEAGYKGRKAGESRQDITRHTFKHFDVKSDCKAGLQLCYAVASSIPKIDKLASQDGVRAAYLRCFDGYSFDSRDVGTGYGLFRNEKAPSLGPRTKMLGDYLLFRAETHLRSLGISTTLVSRSFVRFYRHKNEGLRFMLLSIASENHHLAARGWVSDIQTGYLCSGQIISRAAVSRDGERVVGGMSTIVIDTNSDSNVTIVKGENSKRVIEGTSVLHLRAMYGHPPSFSRGYLIRCIGAEKQGGSDEEDEPTRYESVKKLQELLRKKYSNNISLTKTADILNKATGISKKHFYEKNRVVSNPENVADQIKLGPSGLLVNIPFSETPESNFVSADSIKFPPNKRYKSARSNSHREIGIKLDI